MCAYVRVGKGWAKGLTASTDPRVARAASAHRGRRYVRRTPPELRRFPPRTLPLEWSPKMAYVVGLIATDGCLIDNGRTISFTTNDRQLAQTFLSCLGRPLAYGTSRTRIGNPVFRVQMGDVELYRWLQSVGLTPRKSLTLGQIAVPDALTLPLARGLLDGDGSVINKTYRSDTGRTNTYYWEYLQTRFYSASQPHLAWLRAAEACARCRRLSRHECSTCRAASPLGAAIRKARIGQAPRRAVCRSNGSPTGTKGSDMVRLRSAALARRGNIAGEPRWRNWLYAQA